MTRWEFARAAIILVSVVELSTAAEQDVPYDPSGQPVGAGKASPSPTLPPFIHTPGSKGATPGTYRIVMTNSERDWDAFRFNAQTGATWWRNMEKDPVWAWQKMVDANPLPPSDYDVKAVIYTNGGATAEQIFRIDRKSGRSWFLDDSAWTEIAEPPEFANTSPPKNGFQLFMTNSPSDWNAYRFNPENGETWIPDNNPKQPTWKKTADATPLRASDYEFQVVTVVSNGQGVSKPMRLDRRTGRVWVALDIGWVLFDEPRGFDEIPAPSTGFRLELKASPGGWLGYRLNPQTGETYSPNFVGNGAVWQWIEDRSGLPRGDYDVQAIHWADNNGDNHGLLRIDRKSGRLWCCWDDQAWDEVIEEPDFAQFAVPDDGYRWVVDNSDKDWYAFRFNPDNGQTWSLDKQGDGWFANRWLEPTMLIKGVYDVGMIAFVSDGSGTENVYRMDTRSGRAWVYTGKWVPIQGPLGVAHSPIKPGYQLHLCRELGGCQPFRFDAETGDTWTADLAQLMTWDKVADAQQVPNGAYQLTTTAWLRSDNKTYMEALRTNVTTGQTSFIRDMKWMPIVEPH